MSESKACWKAIFPFQAYTRGEMKLTVAWLSDHLKPPNRYEALRCTLIITSPTRDSLFKTAQWIRYRSPVGFPIGYTVIGLDEKGNVTFRSSCTKCREGVEGDHPHKAEAELPPTPS